MSSLAIAAFWGLLLICSVSRSGSIFALLFASMAFGSFAVVPPALTGGVTLLGTPFVVLGLLFWILRTRGAFRNAVTEAASPRTFLLLTLFTAFAILSAVVMPRLLAGSIYVIPVRAGPEGLSLLRPTSQNITQSLYLLISLVLALSTYEAARLRPAAVFIGALIGGGVLILSGLADMFAGDSGLLDPFRTATYALHTTQTISGTERITGLMPEPSSFGATCVGMAALIHFLGSGFALSRQARLATTGLVSGLALMAVQSTSSTAIVMLAVFVALALASGLYGLVIARQALPRTNVLSSLILGLFVAAAVLFLIAFAPSILTPVFDLLDQLVFKKVQSQSFDERSGWNLAAWNAFLASNGLGVGLGSARASSWALVILSNTGLIGFTLFASFLVQLLIKRNGSAPALLKNRANGAKLALLVTMTGSILAATSADFGGLIAISFGLILAWHYPPERPVGRIHDGTLRPPPDNTIR